ncbi:MAG: ABC transporter ATP-binding protein [Syntrophomonas sp.]
MAGVRITGLSKRYVIGKEAFFALEKMNLSIEDGSFTAIVGKSGCGKTTFLRLLCGLEEKTSGEIKFTNHGRESNVSDEMRIGIMFQEPRLMPWLTVRENIAFSLFPSQKEIKKDADRHLQTLGLELFKDAYPSQISGGMAQRTALGRALYYDPDMILMDEPFGALDYFTRKKLQNEMVGLFLNQKKTFVFVTHDIEEAVYLSEKVIVLEAGRIVQELPVELPYPRKTNSPEFLNITEGIYKAIIA